MKETKPFEHLLKYYYAKRKREISQFSAEKMYVMCYIFFAIYLNRLIIGRCYI